MKTTKRHFDIFKKECEKWIETLGLRAWRINYLHQSEKVDNQLNGNQAIIYMNRGAMAATCILNRDWNNNFSILDVKKCAFHEMCELLLKPLRSLADARWNVDSDDMEYETHRIIRTLENVVFERMK